MIPLASSLPALLEPRSTLLPFLESQLLPAHGTLTPFS